MSVIGGASQGVSTVDTGDIGHSLRLRSAASAYLSRTFASNGLGGRKLSLFGAFKRGKLSTTQTIIYVDSGIAWYSTGFELTSGDQLHLFTYQGGIGTKYGWTTTRVFRDPTAWVYWKLDIDTALSGAASRRLWINGTEETSLTAEVSGFNTPGMPTYLLDGYAHSIGTAYDGYLARICGTDNTLPLISEIGYLNTETNTWITKSQSAVKAVVDAGGTNSFMLDFDNGASLTTLGYDKSSKGNNWTLNNVSLTAGSTYDWMLDVPGDSYATLNPLCPGTIVPTNGNLTITGIGAHRNILATTAISTLVYAESYPSTAQRFAFGIGTSALVLTSFAAGQAAYKGMYSDSGGSGSIYDGTTLLYSGVPAISGTQVWQIAIDPVSGKGWLGLNNVWYNNAGGTTGDPATGANPTWTGITSGDYFAAFGCYDAVASNINFGQRPFAYTPPTGFKALSQANLEEGAIRNPKKHFDVVTVTKSGDTNFTIPWDATVYDTFFEIKDRNLGNKWYQIDGLRGYDKYLSSNVTTAETTDANVLGISGTTGTLKSTLANGTYVITMRKAGLASARQTNTDGSITSTVSCNVTAGFSIVTYTGTGANATVGHGLGVTPKLMEIYRRDSGPYSRPVYHASYWNITNGLLFLDSILVGNSNSGYFSSAPSSNTFGIATTTALNGSGGTYINYCYADVPGYQKIGSIVMNSSADGAYANNGFKSKSSVLKRSDSTSDWDDKDATRSPDNPVNERLYFNTTGIEATTGFDVDYTAQGVKVRTSLAGTYITHDTAETNGKYANAR